MKFGKRIRKELSPSLLRGSIDYKALKGIAKTARQLQQELQLHLNGGGGNGWSNTDPSDRVDEFFARLEVERVKVRPPSSFLTPPPFTPTPWSAFSVRVPRIIISACNPRWKVPSASINADVAGETVTLLCACGCSFWVMNFVSESLSARRSPS